MIKFPSLKVAAIGLSAVIFNCLTAHGQAVGNVVITEQSSTVLTETLNGAPIGEWVNLSNGSSPYDWLDNSVAGTVYSTAFSVIDFIDPLNPSDILVLFPNYPTMSVYSDEPASLVSYPGSGPAGPLSDYVPYASGNTEITTVVAGNSVPMDVNITVQGPQVVPEPSTWVLLIFGFVAALAVRRNHCSIG
jgi:hypothetical protein